MTAKKTHATVDAGLFFVAASRIAASYVAGGVMSPRDAANLAVETVNHIAAAMAAQGTDVTVRGGQ